MTLSGWCRRINNLLRISLLICLFSGSLASCAEAPEEVRELAETRAGIRAALISAQPAQAPRSASTSVEASAAALITYLQFIAELGVDPMLDTQLSELRSAYLKLLDPVWGGVYLAVTESGRDRLLDPEKRLWAQAAALRVFAAAYQATKEQRYMNSLSAVDEYLQESLAAADGSYFIGQLTKPDNLPLHIPVQRYWSLRSEHERRRFGIPDVDREVSTAANARLIGGYSQAFAATGDANYLRVASRAAQFLIATRREPAGWISEHAASSDTTADPLRLETQGLMGLALLDLYQAGMDAQWLDAAAGIAEYLVTEVPDSNRGEGAFVAAEFLHRLSRFIDQPSWAEHGRELLLGIADQPLPDEDTWQLARLGLVLESFAAGYLELVISGEPDALATRRLYAAALAVYQPRKLVLMDRSDRFPDSSQATLHVCTVHGCLPPVSDPGELPAVLSSMGPDYNVP